MLPGLLALLLPSGAEARQPIIPDSHLPGLGSTDSRRTVNGTEPPWQALGRVQTELGGRCTGTLLDPRTVLTAAHCLVAPRATGLVQPKSVHFLLGYHLGQWRAEARVVSFRIGPGFQAAERGPPAADWALLTLDRPLPGFTLPLLTAPLPTEAPLMLGGYQQDRRELLLADTACKLRGLRQQGGVPLLLHDCAGTRGVSGGPLLARAPGGGWGVAGIAVGAGLNSATGIAVPAASIAP
jgi:protease YdgD